MRKKNKYYLSISMIVMAMLFIGNLTMATADLLQSPAIDALNPETDVIAECGPVPIDWGDLGLPTANGHYVWVGSCDDTTYGGCGEAYYNSGLLPPGTTTHTITGLPEDGRTLHLRVWYNSGSGWQSYYEMFTAASGCEGVGCGGAGELCGGPSPDGCWCDTSCVANNDCCVDVNSYFDVCVGPAITSPAPGSELICLANTFNWTNNGAPVSSWYLWAGPCNDDSFGGCGEAYYNSGPLSAGTMSHTISGLPTDGSPVWVRLWFNIGGTWNSVSYQYIANDDCGGGDVGCGGAGELCGGPSPDGCWCDTSCVANNDCCVDVNSYFDVCVGPAITSPAPGSELICLANTFNWTNNGAPVSSWYLWAGPCNDDSFGGCGEAYYNSGPLSAGTMSHTISGLPTDGSPVWVRLWFNIGGTWNSVSYQYIANDDCGGGDVGCGGAGELCGGPSPDGCWCDTSCVANNDCCVDVNSYFDVCVGPAITSPAPGSELICLANTFNWTNNGAPVSSWYLWAGPCNDDSFGGCGEAYYNSGPLSAGTMSHTISGLPTDGSPVWVRLWFNIGGTWNSVSYQYIANDDCGGGDVGCGGAGEFCGEQFTPDGCACDDACVDFNDCCVGVNSYFDVCVSPVVGTWTLNYDFGCNGSAPTAQWNINNNGTYTDNFGYFGTWATTDSQVTLTYSGGTVYVGTFSSNHMFGSIYDSGGFYAGCWTADR